MTLAFETELQSDESHVLLEHVSWKTYVSMRRDFDRVGHHRRIIYNRGRMLIVSPLGKHEKWKILIGLFTEAITDELNIPISHFGQTTWRKRKKRGGLEPDECFYVQNEHLVRGRLDISLRKGDPPPDVAVEVDLRVYLSYKLEVYAKLKIPEVWSFDGIEFLMFSLGENGEYSKLERSNAIPCITPSEMKRFLDLYTKMDQHSVVREVRKWACEQKR